MLKSNKNKVPIKDQTIKLPSGGLIYPEDTVVVKPFSINTESIMVSSKNSIQKMCEIVKAVTTTSIDPMDMLVDDVYLILAVARALTYGEQYSFSSVCPACGHSELVSLRVPDQLPTRIWDKEKPPVLSVDLPVCKDTVQFKYLTLEDEKQLTDYERSVSSIFKDDAGKMLYIRRMAKQLVSVNGGQPDDIAESDAYVASIAGEDMTTFYDAISKQQPGIQYKWDMRCDSCGHQYEAFVPIRQDFFRRSRG
jgi:hypothetical protein